MWICCSKNMLWVPNSGLYIKYTIVINMSYHHWAKAGLRFRLHHRSNEQICACWAGIAATKFTLKCRRWPCKSKLKKRFFLLFCFSLSAWWYSTMSTAGWSARETLFCRSFGFSTKKDTYSSVWRSFSECYTWLDLLFWRSGISPQSGSSPTNQT